MSVETRKEKWKNYREEIAKNISLQSSILESNEKLSILSERLKKVFPEYETKFKRTPLKIQDIKFADVETPELFETQTAESIVEIINENEMQENLSLQYIDNFEFSSGQLDELIAEVKVGKVIKEKYVDMENTDDLQMSEIKQVELSKGDK